MQIFWITLNTKHDEVTLQRIEHNLIWKFQHPWWRGGGGQSFLFSFWVSSLCVCLKAPPSRLCLNISIYSSCGCGLSKLFVFYKKKKIFFWFQGKCFLVQLTNHSVRGWSGRLPKSTKLCDQHFNSFKDPGPGGHGTGYL